MLLRIIRGQYLILMTPRVRGTLNITLSPGNYCVNTIQIWNIIPSIFTFIKNISTFIAFMLCMFSYFRFLLASLDQTPKLCSCTIVYVQLSNNHFPWGSMKFIIIIISNLFIDLFFPELNRSWIPCLKK